LSLPEGIKKIHFIGIGGYGMSALAQILLQKSYGVSGSDLKASPLTDSLAARGATVKIGHSADNIGSAELVVYSTAVPDTNPELLETKKRDLPLWHRSELLAALINNAHGIAIAGTHGKTTTTAMVSLLLEAGGLDPTTIIGGVLPAYGSNARCGKSPYLVAEADESDSSFTRYYPRLALVTGMEPDHLEHYDNDYTRLQQAYSAFLANLPPDGTAVINATDPGLIMLASRLECRVIYYALSGSAQSNYTSPHYHAANFKTAGYSSVFDFCSRGKIIVPAVTIGIPGSHNVSNALGALALADQFDLDLPACAAVLADFKGVGRRFEIIGAAGNITVIDDYAHHPTEVGATLEAARPGSSQVICLFQPHRYTRTAAFFDDFARSFRDADLVLLHSVYSAGETAMPGVTSEALAEEIRRRSSVPVIYSDNISDLEKEAVPAACPGGLIITMGAGDVTYSAPRILALLRQNINPENKNLED